MLRSLKKIPKVGVLGLVLAGLLVGSWFFLDYENPFIKKSQVSRWNGFDALEFERWSKQIDQEDGRLVYEKFKEETRKAPQKERHTRAHIFGEVLYEKFGLSGIEYCDETFSYGCYHSFSGTAIQNEGLASVKFLNESCLKLDSKRVSGCQHGLGHGILASLGYEFDDLKKAISECKPFSDNESLSGCIGGVFMEYNLQTMLADDAKFRSYDPENPFFPCRSNGSEFVNSCIFQQTQWWLRVIPGTYEEKVAQVDRYCNTLETSDLRLVCYKGIGNHIGEILLSWDPYATRDLCNFLSHKEAQIYCHNQAAYVFKNINLADEAVIICQDLKEEDKTNCFRYAGLKEKT